MNSRKKRKVRKIRMHHEGHEGRNLILLNFSLTFVSFVVKNEELVDHANQSL
jgi:hypothetical protein